MTHFTPKYTNELKISFLISGFLALISIHNTTYSFLARFFLNDSNCTFQPPDYHNIFNIFLDAVASLALGHYCRSPVIKSVLNEQKRSPEKIIK